MIAVEVVPTSTVKELRAMLLEGKDCEGPIERQLLRVEVLTAGLLVDDQFQLRPVSPRDTVRIVQNTVREHQAGMCQRCDFDCL